MNEQTNEQKTDQKSRVEGVQEGVARKKVLRPLGVAPSLSQAQQRLKAERVQRRLQRLPGWRLQSGGRAVDRVWNFPNAQVAASFLSYAALLASQTGQPFQATVSGETVVVALPGRSTRPGGGITEEVLDLAEQLG